MMDDLQRRVFQYVRRYGLLAQGDAVIVGVSGGPDSVCLLHLLCRLASELDLRLHVAHLDHGLRGAESAADADFVAGLAAEWGLPCLVGRADVIALADQASLSLEEAARQARYRFLAEAAEKTGATVIAVGHNADDQAETVLMHFLRGSGVAGLRGMLPRALLGEYRLSVAESGRVGEWAYGRMGVWETAAPAPPHPHTPTLHLVRPLLITPRAEIAAYCASHDLRWRFDRSNEDTTFFRNRLRHELLPILADYNPAIREVLSHTAEVLAGDYALLRADVEAAWARVVLPGDVMLSGSMGNESRHVPGTSQVPDTFAVFFDRAAWRDLPLGLQRATIRQAIHRLRHNLRNINWEHVEAAVWLAREGQTGQAATLAAGLELRLGYTTLRIAAEGAPWTIDAPQTPGPIALIAPGTTDIGGGWTVAVTLLQFGGSCTPDSDHDPWTAYLDADAVGPELTLRPRAAGDRFQPQGLGRHSTKLNEFMINAKIPQDVRAGWPLLVGQSGIAWVCGLRVDERAAVRHQTREVWRVQVGRQVDK